MGTCTHRVFKFGMRKYEYYIVGQRTSVQSRYSYSNVCVLVNLYADELKDAKGRLKSLSEEVKVLAKRSIGEPLNKSTKTLVEMVQKTVQGIEYE